MDIAWSTIFWKLVVLKLNFECDDVDSCDDFFALNLGTRCDRYQRHRILNDCFELSELGFIAVKQVKFSALFRRQTTESLNFSIRNLVLP